MGSKMSRSIQRVWLAVLALFAGVAATTFAVMNVLNTYAPDDSGAIALIPEVLIEQQPADTQPPATVPSATVGTPETLPEVTLPPETLPEAKPGFETEDEKTQWETNTRVELFRTYYRNGQQEIVIQSDNSDKVIAPGAKNSYVFKVKNTGNVALDYSVELTASFSADGMRIPVQIRVSRFDGKWVLGDQDTFADANTMEKVADSETLGAGNHAYYTVEWMWPFESGDDAYDTLLGDLAVGQDLVFALQIETTAMESADPDDGGGLGPPKTGDSFSMIMWAVLAVASFGMMIVLLALRRQEQKQNRQEAKRS